MNTNIVMILVIVPLAVMALVGLRRFGQSEKGTRIDRERRRAKVTDAPNLLQEEQARNAVRHLADASTGNRTERRAPLKRANGLPSQDTAPKV